MGRNQERADLGSLFCEATTGFEPVIRVLQTLALPLGHVAVQDYSVFNSTTGFGLPRSQLRDQGLQALAEPVGLPLGHVAFFISLFQVYDERLLTDMLLSAI